VAEARTAQALIRGGMLFANYLPEFTKADHEGSPPKSRFNPPIGEANPSPFANSFQVVHIQREAA